MTVTTLRPNGSTGTSGTVGLTGAASVHAALSDNSDSSYVSVASLEVIKQDMEDLTLPANAVIRDIAVRYRSTRFSLGTSTMDVSVESGGILAIESTAVTWTTPTTITALVSPRDVLGNTWTDPVVDGAQVVLRPTGGASSIDVYAVYLDVTYAVRPTVSVSAPTGTITTTTTPQAVWSNTLDSDGGPQTAFEVKYFTAAQYDIGGFNASSSPYTLSSGVVASSSTSYTPTTPLADATYRAYVRVAQTVNGSYHWSDWAYSGFALSVNRPGTPAISLYPDSDDACMHITVTGNSGDATTDAIELQRSTDGGLTWEPVRLLDPDPET